MKQNSAWFALQTALVAGGLFVVLEWLWNKGAFSVPDVGSAVAAGIVAVIIAGFSHLPLFFLGAPARLDEDQDAHMETERSIARQALSEAADSYACLERESAERYKALEQQCEDLKAARPVLRALTLMEHQGRLVVAIKNAGAPATVWAKLSVYGNTLTARNNVYATWRGANTQEIWLGNGETHEVIVARPGHGEGGGASLFEFYYWVPFIENGLHDECRALAPSWPNDPNPNARLRVKIEIYSRPESTWPPIVFSLTLVGCDRVEDVTGVIWLPPPVKEQHEETSPWQDFYIVAGECIVMFHSMLEVVQEAVQVSPEEWQAFIHKAGRAHMLAARISEAHRDEARSLARLLAEADHNNLTASAPAAAALQSFLFRVQYGVSS